MTSLNKWQPNLNGRVGQNQKNVLNGLLGPVHDGDMMRPRKPELTDMPPEVLGIIFKNLGWRDRCAVRKVSRQSRAIVDTTKQHFDKIILDLGICTSQLKIQDQFSEYVVKYKNMKFRDQVRIFMEEGPEGRINEKRCWKAARNDLLVILRSPKVEIGKLQIEVIIDIPYFNMTVFKNCFDDLKHKIHLTKFVFKPDDPNDIYAILPHVKPGILQSLKIFCYNHGGHIRMDEIAELEHWKSAKEIRIHGMRCKGIDILLNFTGFQAYLPCISTDDFARLRRAFHESPNFLYGLVYVSDEDSIERIQVETRLEDRTIEGNLEINFDSTSLKFFRVDPNSNENQ